MRSTFLFFILLLSLSVAAQKKYSVAVFTPLYLDSVFDASGNFKFEKKDFPKYVLSGLEFYQGVQKALDSLNQRGAPLEVHILDSRGKLSIQQQLQSKSLEDLDLIIAHSSGIETLRLAEEAQRRKVPFISATFPNDLNVTNNPYFVILNTTLPTHMQNIYQFLQTWHGSEKVVVFRRSGNRDNQVQSYFDEVKKNSTKKGPEFRIVDLPDNFSSASLAPYLDSTRRTVCLAPSLDAAFGQRLIQQLDAINERYPVRLIGMPTWENLNISRTDLEVIYTSPFFYNGPNILSATLEEEYQQEFTNKPSDLFFRGYETMLRFGLLLLDSKEDISSNLIKKGNTVFTSFDIQPVFKNKEAMTLDYFENRHVYFIRVLGSVKNTIN